METATAEINLTVVFGVRKYRTERMVNKVKGIKYIHYVKYKQETKNDHKHRGQ